MEMQKLIKYIPGVMLLVFAFTGCLKTNPLYEGFENVKPEADINLSNLSDANDSTTAYSLDLLTGPNAANETIDTAIAVHLSAKNHVGDVTFKLARVDDDPTFQAFFKHNQLMFDIWNNATQEEWDAIDEATQEQISDYVSNHDELTLLPDSLYSVDNWDVTIKDAGVLNVGRLLIKVKTGAVDADGVALFATHNFVIPIAIQDAGGYDIASNFRMIFLVLKGKNAYDGKYHYTTTANTSLQPSLDKNVVLTTAGTQRLHFGLLGTYSNDVWYTINKETNQITVECPSLGVQEPQDPRSKYDPATKTLHVYWKQAGGGRTFEETFVYTGPR
jgi:hypothetical protein